MIEALLNVVMALWKAQGLSVCVHRDHEVDWTEQKKEVAENQDNFVKFVCLCVSECESVHMCMRVTA